MSIISQLHNKFLTEKAQKYVLQLQLTQYLPDKQGEYLIGKTFSFSQITGMYPDEFLLLICVNMCHLGAEDYACIYELNLLY